MNEDKPSLDPVDKAVEKSWRNLPRPRAATVIALAVVFAWLGFQLYAAGNPEFEVPGTLDSLLLLVVGAWFTSLMAEKNKESKVEKGNGNSDASA